jgi:hypothetical protein
MASGQFANVTAGQEVFIPSNTTDAAQQNLGSSIQSFNASSLNQWWNAPNATAQGTILGIPWEYLLSGVAVASILVVAAVYVTRGRSRQAAPAVKPSTVSNIGNTMGAKYCRFCGSPVSAGATFCNQCGNRLS